MEINAMIDDRDYKHLIEKQIHELMHYLFSKEITFNIVCNINAVKFEPELPESISSNFKPLTLFAISGYTFSSARFEGNYLVFEAGFGPASFASVVKVPLFAVMQIIVGENIMFINMIAGNEKYIKELDSKKTSQKSINAFLKNPNNKNLIDKINS